MCLHFTEINSNSWSIFEYVFIIKYYVHSFDDGRRETKRERRKKKLRTAFRRGEYDVLWAMSDATFELLDKIISICARSSSEKGQTSEKSKNVIRWVTFILLYCFCLVFRNWLSVKQGKMQTQQNMNAVPSFHTLLHPSIIYCTHYTVDPLHDDRTLWWRTVRIRHKMQKSCSQYEKHNICTLFFHLYELMKQTIYSNCDMPWGNIHCHFSPTKCGSVNWATYLSQRSPEINGSKSKCWSINPSESSRH